MGILKWFRGSVFYEFFHILKAEIYQIDKIQRFKNGKNGSFRTSWFSNLDFP